MHRLVSQRLVAVFLLAGPLACTRPGAAPAKATAPAVTSAQEPAMSLEARRKALADLIAEEWEYNLSHHPVFATIVGDKRWNDRMEDMSVEAIQRDLEAKRRFRDRFAAIDATGFTDQEQLNRDLMIYELGQDLEAARFKDWEMPVNQVSGIQLRLPQLVTIIPLATVKDYEDYITRLHAVPRLFDQITENMRQGVRDGLVPPKILLAKAVAQTEQLAKVPAAETPFVTVPLGKLPASFSDADKARLRDALVEAVTNDVQPAYDRLAKFLRDEYLPHGRTEPGVWALPDGAQRYAFLVARSTTTKLTPDEIHEIGLKQVAKIEAQMLAIAKKLGYDDLKSFQAAVRDDPRLKAGSADGILGIYRQHLADMKKALPKLFGRLPKADVEVMPVEAFRAKSAADANYMPPAPDGSRPGYVQVNTYDPQSRSIVEMEATAYHEGLPGHHLQLALQQELPGLPEFRKHGGFGAFVEGWALYSEQLGKEVGLYRDPYSDYGRLQSEMLRAIRLVVDTGFHAKRWSRDQVVQFFHDHSAIDEITVQNETDRYIAWPAQALSYMVGQLDILKLRESAEKALGDRFDIRSFHDEILGGGALPLDVLNRRVDAWIAAQKS